MKKIEKLDVLFESGASHSGQLLQNKINELTRVVNFNNGHVEFEDAHYLLGEDAVIGLDRSEDFDYALNGLPLQFKEPDWLVDPTLTLLDKEEEKKLLKNHSVDNPIQGDNVLFENFIYNNFLYRKDGTFNIVGVGIPMVSEDPEKDLKDFFSKTALLYYGLWHKKATFKERMSGKLFSNIKLRHYGKVFMGLKDKERKTPVWYFENVNLSFEEIHDFDKTREKNIFYFKQINLAVLENGRYQVEKWRTKVTEIKIGYKLHNEFLKIHGTLPNFEHGGKPFEVGKPMRFCGAKIYFVHAEDDTYYMKPNEILFLSECDHIYARGIKKG